MVKRAVTSLPLGVVLALVLLSVVSAAPQSDGRAEQLDVVGEVAVSADGQDLPLLPLQNEVIVDDQDRWRQIFCITTPCWDGFGFRLQPEDRSASEWHVAVAPEPYAYRGRAVWVPGINPNNPELVSPEIHVATWSVELPSAGRWQVAVYVPMIDTDMPDTQDAHYCVTTRQPRAAAEMSPSTLPSCQGTEVRVDQTRTHGWVTLGSFDFPDGVGMVQLTNMVSDASTIQGSDARSVLADAVRWSRQVSSSGSVRVDTYLRGYPDGSTFKSDSQVRIGYAVSRPVYVRWTYCEPDGCRVIVEGYDDGSGDDTKYLIVRDIGIRRLTIEAFDRPGGNVIARDETYFYVVNTNVPPPPPSPPSPGPPPAPCSNDKAEFVEGTNRIVVTAGKPFTVTYTLKNAGNCAWRKADNYHLANVNNTAFGAEPRRELPKDVLPGDTVTFVIDGLKIPAPGSFQTQWQLKHGLENVGPGVYTIIETAGPEIPSLQRVVVLVHGWQGLNFEDARKLDSFDCSQGVLAYDEAGKPGNKSPKARGEFGNMAETLSQQGYHLYFARWTSGPFWTIRIDDAAKCLSDQITTVLERERQRNNPVAKVTLIAHSMGGLVSRAMIDDRLLQSRPEAQKHVEQLITFGTPHHGVPMQPLSILLNLSIPEGAADLYVCAASLVANRTDLCELSPTNMRIFNLAHRPAAAVAYDAVGGYAGWPVTDGVKEYHPGDGIIPLSSAKGDNVDGAGKFNRWRAHFSHVDGFNPGLGFDNAPESLNCLKALIDPNSGKRCVAGFELAGQSSETVSSAARAWTVAAPAEESSPTSDLPTIRASIGEGGTHTESLLVDGDDLNLIFRWTNGVIDIGLKTPDGDVVTSENIARMFPGADFVRQQDTDDLGFAALRIPRPPAGRWQLTMTKSKGTQPSNVVAVASVESPIQLRLDLPTSAGLDENFEVAAELTQSGEPIALARVSAQLVTDSGPQNVELREQPGGRYTATLKAPGKATQYFLVVRAEGNSGATEREFAREASGLIYVRPSDILHNGAAQASVIDTNGNKLYDELSVTMPIRIQTAAIYSLGAILRAPSGREIASVRQDGNWPAGSREVVFSFDGHAISGLDLDGPYTVDVEGINTESMRLVLDDKPLLATSAYQAREFEGATAPALPRCTPGGSGIILYEKLNFGGRCVTLTENAPELGVVLFDNMAASMQMAGEFSHDWEVTLYQQTNYTGQSSTFTSDDPDFSNDAIGAQRASSVKIRRRDPLAHRVSTLFLPVAVASSACPKNDQFADVVLLFDTSAAMTTLAPDGGPSRLARAVDAARSMLVGLRLTSGGDRVGIMAYDLRPTVLQTLTSDAEAIEVALGRVLEQPSTVGRIELALYGLLSMFNEGPTQGRSLSAVLLRDNGPGAETGSTAVDAAELVKSRDIRLYVVGLGDSASSNALRGVASDPRSAFIVSDVADLPGIYRTLRSLVQCPGIVLWPR